MAPLLVDEEEDRFLLVEGGLDGVVPLYPVDVVSKSFKPGSRTEKKRDKPLAKGLAYIFLTSSNLLAATRETNTKQAATNSLMLKEEDNHWGGKGNVGVNKSISGRRWGDQDRLDME